MGGEAAQLPALFEFMRFVVLDVALSCLGNPQKVRGSCSIKSCKLVAMASPGLRLSCTWRTQWCASCTRRNGLHPSNHLLVHFQKPPQCNIQCSHQRRPPSNVFLGMGLGMPLQQWIYQKKRGGGGNMG